MSESYIKAEIVQPRPTVDAWVIKLLTGLLNLATAVLIIWWFFAAWFPELGLTYWQLVLPYYAARLVFSGRTFTPRLLTK